MSGAIIETNKVLLVEDGNKKTFTFPVSRTYPNNKVENLILNKNEDETFSGVLIQYELTKQEREQMINGHQIDLRSKTKIYNIENINVNINARIQTDIVGCYEITWETGYCSSGQHFSGNDDDCVVGGAPQPEILSIVDTCESSSGGGGSGSSSGGSGPSSGSPISGGGGGGGGSTTPSSPYNTFIFASFDDAYNLCPEGDSQCSENWSHMASTVAYFNSLGMRGGLDLAGYNDIFFTVKNYLINNNFYDDQNFLKNRLKIVSQWMQRQGVTNSEQTLENFKFAYWALKFLMNQPNQDIPNYYLSNPLKFDALHFTNFNPSNLTEAPAADAMATMITEYFVAEQNGTVSQLQNNWIGWDLVEASMEYFIKTNIVGAVKLGRWIYEFADAYFPAMNIPLINLKIAEMRSAILLTDAINMNPNTMKWKDIVACWLMEVGDFPVNTSAGYSPIPTIGFTGTDYVISGIPNQLNQMRYLVAHKTLADGNFSPGSINFLRKKAMENIKQGDLSPFDGNWGFGFDAMVDTIKELDGLQYCLGSYITTVNITSLGNNQYKLTFIVKNKTGWESGTRGLNDYDGNSTNDSIIPDKPRGQGIHLGGTIGETFGWYEIVTVIP